MQVVRFVVALVAFLTPIHLISRPNFNTLTRGSSAKRVASYGRHTAVTQVYGIGRTYHHTWQHYRFTFLTPISDVKEVLPFFTVDVDIKL